MVATGTDSPLFRFLQRHVVETLTLLYFLILLYVTLLPFDFSADSTQLEPAGRSWGLIIVRPIVPDVASNFGLYLPFGVLVCATLGKHGAGKPASMALAVLLAAVLSYGAEYSQRFSPSRICSVADFLANITGAACGSLGAHGVVWLAGRASRANRRDVIERPSAAVARITAFALLVAALVPFDLTFIPDRFAGAVSNLRLVPFERLDNLALAIEAAAGRGDAAAYYARYRDWWMLRLDYGAQAAGYAVLAVLTAYYLRRHCKTPVQRTVTWTIAACSILAVVGGVTQVFVLSRGFDVTYILVGIVGAMLGVVVCWPLWRAWAGQPAANPGPRLRSRKRLAVAAVTVIAAFIVLRETAPFLPVLTANSVADQLAQADRVPMLTYLQARLPVATEDLLSKFAHFALLGIAVALWRTTPPDARPARPWATGLVVAAGVALLESFQLLLPSRIPAVTDVLLGLSGTAFGVQAYRMVIAYHHMVSVHRRLERIAAVRFDVEFGPPEAGPPEAVPAQPVRYDVELGPPQDGPPEEFPPQPVREHSRRRR
ncbi:MAG: VanZ family protein [Phycisphaerales bacterium]|nr:MAG: VanZ family protein [Phycisphaerales bacterium]